MTDTTIPQVAAPEAAVNAEAALAKAGVFKGAHGLRGLVESREFWDRRPYGTRLYYGQGEADYLHHSVLKTALEILDRQPVTVTAQPSESQQAPCNFDPVAWFDVFNACVYFDPGDATRAVAGGNKVFPVESVFGSPAEPKTLPPIDRDESIERDYIPLPGCWEVQTKGKGSSFRLCDTKSGERWIVMDKYLQAALEQMAREIRDAFLSKETNK